MWYSYIETKLTDDGEIRAAVTTDDQSPWYHGHFPGDPILPGIAQLNMVTTTISKVLQKELVLQSLGRVKFKQLIRPGEILNIHAVNGKNQNNYSFTITCKHQEVCSGRLVLTLKKEQQSTNGN